MPEFYPDKRYRPWRWRLRPSYNVPSFDGRPTPGWISINLVRRPRRYGFAHSMLLPPATLVAAVTALPLPPRVYLQAVNRSSTF